jgi:hypothetical protein
MSDPFNMLADALEQDFAHKFDIVTRGLRNAAGVAADLGINIDELSGVLGRLRDDHLGDIESSRDVVNTMLAAFAAGEEIDISELQAQLGHIESMERLMSERLQGVRELQFRTNRIDFTDWRQASRGLADINEFFRENHDLLVGSAAAIEASSQGLRDVAIERHNRGYMTDEELQRTLASINLTRRISLDQLDDEFERLNADVRAIAQSANWQLVGAGSELLRNQSTFNEYSNHIASLLHTNWNWVFAGDTDTERLYRRRVMGELYDIIEMSNQLLLDTDLPPLSIRCEAEMEEILATLGIMRDTVDRNPIYVPVVARFRQAHDEVMAAAVAATEGDGSALDAVHALRALLELPAYAEGGFINSPELALVGEDGPEYVIPVGGSRRQRGEELWTQAGRSLGLLDFGGSGGGGGGAMPAITVTSNPTIYATGVDDLEEQLNRHAETVSIMVFNRLEEYELNRRRSAYV